MNRISTPAAGLSAFRELSGLERYFRGLDAIGLLDELTSYDSVTLIAPAGQAFDALPWRFDELLRSPELVEPRFDLFEYLVVRGRRALGSGRCDSVQGESLLLDEHEIRGRHGSARVLSSLVLPCHALHVVDSCLLPVRPSDYAAFDPPQRASVRPLLQS